MLAYMKVDVVLFEAFLDGGLEPKVEPKVGTEPFGEGNEIFSSKSREFVEKRFSLESSG